MRAGSELLGVPVWCGSRKTRAQSHHLPQTQPERVPHINLQGDCKDFKIQVSVPAMDYPKFKEGGHGIMPEIVKVGSVPTVQ